MMIPIPSHLTFEQIKPDLCFDALKQKWQRVIQIYKNYPQAHRTKVNMSGDTALHIAISNGQQKVVKELVSIVQQNALAIQNDLGNTPLHLAASLGNVKISEIIAARDSSLLGIRNSNGETPLFVAALHGRTAAFRCMHYLCEDSLRSRYCVRSDRDTILHSAISGEFFELAFEIIDLYPELRSAENELGKTPLHVLASKPDAFKSGTDYGLFHELIYRCVQVEKLKPSNVDNIESSRISVWDRVLPNVDQENPEGPQTDDYHDEQVGSSDGSKGPGPDFSIFKCLRYVPKKVEKIREGKKKHVWAFQIMEKLLEPYSRSEDKQKTSFRRFGESKHHPMFAEEMVNKKKESALLTAVKHGIIEMVEKILEILPMAIHDVNNEEKNIVLLAVENRQPQVYKLLVQKRRMRKFEGTVFEKRDKYGNSALHIAATKSENHEPLGIPGPALKMQWETKWYKFVEKTMASDFYVGCNSKGETPTDIFIETHKGLIKEAGDWLKGTSESCSVVASLIATVAFATSTAIPGGVNSESGTPALEK